MLRIYVAAKALTRPLLNRKGAVLAALVAAIVAALVGPFIASVLISPAGPNSPSTQVVVQGVVASTQAATTAIATGLSVDGQIVPLPFESILAPTDQASSPALSNLLDHESLANTMPFDNLAFVNAAFDASTESPDFIPEDPANLPQGSPGFPEDSLFFASEGGITSGPSVSSPVDLSSLSSSELDFTVTVNPTSTESGGTGANPGLTIPGKILVIRVPEPSLLLLMSAGLGGFVLLISRLIH